MMRSLATLAALHLCLAAAPAAASTYYDFSNDPAGQASVVDYGAFTATSSASFLSIRFPSLVSTGPVGLGVAAQLLPGLPLDLQPTQIDGMPAGVTESLTISFTQAVRLVNFTVGEAQFGDEYEFSINGGPRQMSTLAFNALNANRVNTFELFAVGRLREDGVLGNDAFTLRAIEVAAVPVPGALGLLGGALAALGLLRRRR